MVRGSLVLSVVVFFFFKQKTAYEIYQCDWSSDVCSSDLEEKRRKRLGSRPSLARSPISVPKCRTARPRCAG